MFPQTNIMKSENRNFIKAPRGLNFKYQIEAYVYVAGTEAVAPVWIIVDPDKLDMHLNCMVSSLFRQLA